MQKRKQRGWLVLITLVVVALVLVPAFFWTGKQQVRSSAYKQQSVQPGLPITVRQVEYRDPQPRETQLLLYPNPVKHTLHVVLPQKYASFVWLGIYQSNGQLWKKYAIESGRVIEINVQALPVGDYVLKVGDRQGRTWSAKFFKA